MAKLIRPLIVAVVLGVASPAWAECAWALWERTVTISSSGPLRTERWDYLEADTDRRLCERRLEDAVRHIHRAEKLAESRHQTQSDGLTLFLSESIITKAYKCIPDTIDPRGPKAGGR